MSIGKVHFVLALALVAASCKAPTDNNPPAATPAWVVSTLAGSGTRGFEDGAGNEAQFNNPAGVAVDSSGNVYVADYYNHRIRKVTAEGEVSTLAGSGTEGSADTGTNTSAQFDSPHGVAVDSSGNVYVADSYNHRIRKITANGTVSTLAGSGATGVNGGGFADTGPNTSAQFNRPAGVAVDSSGNVYVADTWNHRIRKVTADGTVSTLAGSSQGFANGAGSSAQFNRPNGVAVDSSGNVYVADRNNNRIRKVTAADGTVTVSTLAGTGTAGFADGTGNHQARFSQPVGVAVDSSGNVYVADYGNHRIRKVTAEGEVSTLAGSSEGFANGAGSSAQFDNPAGVAVDSDGKIYVADYYNHRIRKMEYKVP